MNDKEVIEYLASAEARCHAPKRRSESSSIAIPFFDIAKISGANYSVTPFGHKGHDNEDRAGFVGSFLQSALAGTDPGIDASGLYPFELHDSCSYLAPDSKEMREKYRGSLNFSKNTNHDHAVLVPDMYQMNGYSDLLRVRDKTPFRSKVNRVLFAGTTTGDKDPTKNARIQTCLWSTTSKIRDSLDLYITNVAQMSVSDIHGAYPGDSRLQRIFKQPIPLQDHWKYKYVLNIEGNTCCWSRVPMIMASKSLMINLAHKDRSWYYPLMHHGRDFYNIDGVDELESALQFCKNNEAWCEHVISNANQFVESFLGRSQAIYYTTKLFEKMAANKDF